jgi:hypothetical protein
MNQADSPQTTNAGVGASDGSQMAGVEGVLAAWQARQRQSEQASLDAGDGSDDEASVLDQILAAGDGGVLA